MDGYSVNKIWPGIREAAVYGVPIAGAEGTAGMATIVAEGKLDFGELGKHLTRELPIYSRPLFLRLSDGIPTTATLKHTTGDLQRQGFDPAATSDPIYFNDQAKKAFVRIDGVRNSKRVR